MGLHPGIRFLPEIKPQQDSNIGDNIGGIVATRLLSKVTQFLRGRAAAMAAVWKSMIGIGHGRGW